MRIEGSVALVTGANHNLGAAQEAIGGGRLASLPSPP
jgi:hypothetical protein